MTTRFTIRPAYGKTGFEVVDSATRAPVPSVKTGKPRKFKTRADAISYAHAANCADQNAKNA